MVYRKAAFILSDGFFPDLVRFAFLTPSVYACLGMLGLSSSISKVLLSLPLSIALLSLRVALMLRSLPTWAEKQYEEIRKEIEGVSLADVEHMITQSEKQVKGLRDHLAKGVVWADQSQKVPTDVVIVFFHGWSGSRLELSPLVENLARDLGANCFFARLPGHGIPMMGYGKEEDVTCKGFVYEGARALAIAEKLGKRILLVGISTGAALNAWLCCQAWSHNVFASILISANIWVKPSAVIQVFGRIPIVRELIMFKVRGGLTTKTPTRNQLHEAFRTNPYPTHLTSSVFDLSSALALEDPKKLAVPLLAFHNPSDPTVCFKELTRFAKLVRNGRVVEVTPEKSEHQHIITGNAMAPSTLPRFQQEIKTWLAREAGCNGRLHESS